jgi:hypothetical protein
MFTAIGLFLTAIVALIGFLIFQVLYGGGQAAVWSSFFLGCLTMTVFYAIFHSLDWINDWMAGRQAQAFNQQALEDMRNQYRVQTEQARSMSAMLNALGKGQNQIPPHVGFQDEMFEDFDTTPLPD